MSQAKVLNERDVRRVLLFIANNRHAVRNRAMFLTLQFTGMRCGELSALQISHVVGSDGKIKDEINLTAEQTKGSEGRTVYLSKKAKDEIENYLKDKFKLKDLLSVTLTDTSRALFTTQKSASRGFTSGTIAQHFHYMYKGAGIDGASSHSSRRTFITTLANKGVSVRVLMELAGHKAMSVTQRYIDCNTLMVRKSLELL